VSGSRHRISGEQTDVTHMGNAFVCPSDADMSSNGQASR
jgi:hypothetical protein